MTRHSEQVPTDPIDLRTERSTAHVDQMLDEAIAESFPNSDPVALAMPHDRLEPQGNAVGVRKLLGANSHWPLLIVGGVILALLWRRQH